MEESENTLELPATNTISEPQTDVVEIPVINETPSVPVDIPVVKASEETKYRLFWVCAPETLLWWEDEKIYVELFYSVIFSVLVLYV